MATDTVSDDQRKRTSDALERRFAAAKAEVHQQHSKAKTSYNEEDTKHQQPEALHTSPSSSKKGKSVFFSGFGSYQDMEDTGLTYLQLPQSVRENLLTTDSKFEGKRGSEVDKILNNLFQRGDISQKYLSGNRSLRLDNWILLDNYVQPRVKSTGSSIQALRTHSKRSKKSTGSSIQALRTHSKRSKKHMSMKHLKKCGLFNLPQEIQKFDIYKPMHEMWKGYMTQLLKKTGRNQLAQCLLSADLHGAFITVVDCKISSLTGTYGIMIRETAETFGIITQDDKFRVIPKKLSVFIVQVDCWKITFLGDKLTSRNFGLSS